jgi:hypothetical protein
VHQLKYLKEVRAKAISKGMEGTYNRLGNPGIFRNDRFWLAGDHVVEPRVKSVPAVKKLIESSERARKVFKMTEYQGMNVGQANFGIISTCQ